VKDRNVGCGGVDDVDNVIVTNQITQPTITLIHKDRVLDLGSVYKHYRVTIVTDMQQMATMDTHVLLIHSISLRQDEML
jgi:hypothetical protein